MRLFKTLVLLLVSFATMQAQISVNGTVVHLISTATPSAGSISLNVTGGLAPYTYLWNPGAYTTQNISNNIKNSYSVKITDSNADTVVYTYGLGYKVAWGPAYGSEARNDTLMNTASYSYGNAVSENTLPGGTDGWFEYILKGTGDYKGIGFLDSLSPFTRDYSDVDYGFYHIPNGGNNVVYAIDHGGLITLGYLFAEGTVLRVERVGDTVNLKINGVNVYSVTDAVGVQKAWKVKGYVSSVDGLINVGCSFYQKGNAAFPNYTRLVPTVVHSSNLTSADGSINVAGLLPGTNTYTWQPGSVISASLTGRQAGNYNVTVQDSLHNSNIKHYSIGYKTVWDSLSGASVHGDTLTTAGAFLWNRGVSKNVLLAGEGGWFEYVLKDIGEWKFIGFLDSLSPNPQDYSDIDYGFYHIPNGGANVLYAVDHGGLITLGYFFAEGTVLRVERIGDTVNLKINGVIVYTLTDTVAAQKSWSVKGLLYGVSNTSLINVGCSFPFPGPLRALYVQKDVNCIAGQKGKVTVNPIGGNPPYAFSFAASTFTANNIFDSIIAGTYTLNVHDAVGHSASARVTILNCPKWAGSTVGTTINSNGDVIKTTGTDSWTDADLVTAELFKFADTASWVSFQIPDTGSVFVLGFRSLVVDSSAQVTNYKLYIKNSVATVIETDNDGFYNKIEISNVTKNMGFKVQLTKTGIEYYTRPTPTADYQLAYVSKLFSSAKLIIENTLYKSGSRVNTVRVSGYGNIH